MPDALMLCPEAPYPVVGGGPTRTACLLEYLAERYTLDVITFQEPGAPDPRDSFPPNLVRDIRLIRLPYHSKSTASKAWRNLHRYFRNAPPLVDRFAGFPLLLERHYDLGVIEHIWCAPYVTEMRRRCRRMVLNVHNVESVLLERCATTESALGGILFRRFAEACRRLERDLVPRFDTVLVTSDEDRSHLGVGSVWPNALPVVAKPTEPKQPMIAFSGNLAYHPNTAAVQYFSREIWPAIRNTQPELIWRVIGKNPEALDLPLNANIECTGAVDDALAHLSRAQVAVVPLLSGSGTRIKILEAWAAGTPVVSTTIGAEGLNAIAGEHLLIADTPAHFAEAVLSVVNDYSLRVRLGEAGRLRYETKHTWPQAWRILETIGL